jgi:uncharacterized protein YunC (DUF1805 family)
MFVSKDHSVKMSAATATTDEAAETDLDKMTKAELLAYAEAHGVEATESMTKAEIVEAIEAKAEEEKTVTGAGKEPAVNLEKLNKADLLAYATSHGVEASEDMTKAQIIEAIEAKE